MSVLSELMSLSNESCDLDFDCSCAGLRRLVEQVIALEGCLACRLTGAGWGGCVVALVLSEKLEPFLKKMSAVIPEDSTFVFSPGSGAEVVV